MSTRQQRRQASSSQRSLTSTTAPRQFATDNGLKECDPSDIVQKFRQVENAPDRFCDGLPTLDLPDTGAAYDDCRDVFFLACISCGATMST